jgi:hypothetical protein
MMQEILYSGSLLTTTGAGRGSEQSGKEFRVVGSSMEMWNTGWTEHMELGRQSVKECIPGHAMISYGLRYFSESFLDSLVVQKN